MLRKDCFYLSLLHSRQVVPNVKNVLKNGLGPVEFVGKVPCFAGRLARFGLSEPFLTAKARPEAALWQSDSRWLTGAAGECSRCRGHIRQWSGHWKRSRLRATFIFGFGRSTRPVRDNLFPRDGWLQCKKRDRPDGNSGRRDQATHLQSSGKAGLVRAQEV